MNTARIVVVGLFAALVLLRAAVGSAGTFPVTSCDAALRAPDLHLPSTMWQENGTRAFRYGGDSEPFAAANGAGVTLRIALLFPPTPETVITLSALDAACEGGSSTGTVFSYSFRDITAVHNTFAYDPATGEIAFNGLAQQALALGTPRYIWVEVWDGVLPADRAAYSYLIDLLNPQNPPAAP